MGDDNISLDERKARAMADSLFFFINSFVTIFSVLDPFGAALTLIVITPDGDDIARKNFAVRSAKMAAITLLVFTVAGGFIFSFFGISINALMVAGGVILMQISFKMLEGKPLTFGAAEVNDETPLKDDVAIIPMAVPVLAGPAAITTVVVFASRASGTGDWIALLAALTIALLLTGYILRNSLKLSQWLGNTGIRMLTRLMGLILIAMGVEFVLSGFKGYFN